MAGFSIGIDPLSAGLSLFQGIMGYNAARKQKKYYQALENSYQRQAALSRQKEDQLNIDTEFNKIWRKAQTDKAANAALNSMENNAKNNNLQYSKVKNQQGARGVYGSSVDNTLATARKGVNDANQQFNAQAGQQVAQVDRQGQADVYNRQLNTLKQNQVTGDYTNKAWEANAAAKQAQAQANSSLLGGIAGLAGSLNFKFGTGGGKGAGAAQGIQAPAAANTVNSQTVTQAGRELTNIGLGNGSTLTVEGQPTQYNSQIWGETYQPTSWNVGTNGNMGYANVTPGGNPLLNANSYDGGITWQSQGTTLPADPSQLADITGTNNWVTPTQLHELNQNTLNEYHSQGYVPQTTSEARMAKMNDITSQIQPTPQAEAFVAKTSTYGMLDGDTTSDVNSTDAYQNAWNGSSYSRDPLWLMKLFGGFAPSVNYNSRRGYSRYLPIYKSKDYQD